MTTAIVAAAGTGSRMGTDTEKPYIHLKGLPVLIRTLQVFEGSPRIDAVLVVVRPEWRDRAEALCASHGCRKVLRVLPGGDRRQDSVRYGLAALPPKTDTVVVHDGARPLLAVSLLHACLDACGEEVRLRGEGAVCAAVPVKETIRLVMPSKKPETSCYSEKTLDRKTLWAVQTPQVFSRSLLERAHALAVSEGFEGTDDTQLAERLGARIRMVPGDYRNIKLTTPEDLDLAKILLSGLENDGQNAYASYAEKTACPAQAVKAVKKEPDA